MPYITILGAGSTVFARQLMTDILQIEGLDEGCFALVDIDSARLDLACQVAERLIAQYLLSVGFNLIQELLGQFVRGIKIHCFF